MDIQSFLLLRLSYITALLYVWVHSSAAVVLWEGDSPTSLYDYPVQRDPADFPYNLMEPRAQRSHSMRLRFGRRSDPDMLAQSPEKRWFGYVNQKSIRSPSLRLRFGRRSDPTMPVPRPVAYEMSERQWADNNDDYGNDIFDDQFDRVVRKPQRLRFGRSVSAQAVMPQETNENSMDGGDVQDSLNRLRAVLMFLRLHGIDREEDDGDDDDLTQDLAYDDPELWENRLNEFERHVRKPSSMRLRFGRSAGGKEVKLANGEDKAKSMLDQKKNSYPPAVQEGKGNKN